MNSEPRLLLVATVAETLSAFLLPFARHFQEDGWRVDALASGVRKHKVCQSTFTRVWDAEWSRNPLDPRNLFMAGRIRALVEENHYDIVHVHTPVAAFVTRFALNGLRREQHLQVLYTAHGFHFHPMGSAIRNRVFEHLEREAAQWTDFLIVINRHDLKVAKDKKLIGLDQLRFMPGIGVDRARYSRSAVTLGELDGLYHELGMSSSIPVFLMVAEFVERKRHADAILALSKITDPQAKLLLAGSGPLLEAMKRLAANLGLGGRVHFLGPRDDVPVLMKASCALLLPSSQEGLPRCILEALSMGIPVIGSRIRGTMELLERNAGLLVDVGDIDQLARSMQFVLDEPAAAAAIGQAGQRTSEAYDLTRVLQMHEELYEEALERRRSCEPVSARSV